MAATAYPVFDATDSNATLNTSYTHTAASTTAPTIGLFEVSMPEDAVYLRGTVSDDVSPCSNAKITVTVNGKTVETTTNASGTYTITEGLTAGEATVTAVVEGRDTLTKTITLAGGKVNILDIAVPMPAMPNAYSDTLISEAFDENAGALAFNTKATVADGRLALSPGNAASSYADFAAEIQSRTAVDFSFDFKYQNGTNKGGFQFRDSDGRLLFAMCVKTADGGNTMRTPAAASLVGGTQMSEPKWVDHTADANKTYVARVHADFEAGTVSYQLKDKATDKVVLQELNIPTTAKNLARMYSSNWYQAKTQYIDNFVLTARSNEPEPVAVDKTALQKAIDANTCKVETDYTAETWADFAKALADANAVLADENATQTQVDAAAKALTDAQIKVLEDTKLFNDEVLAQVRKDKVIPADAIEELGEKELSEAQAPIVKLSQELNDEVSKLENEKQAEAMEYTISGRIGHALEPLFRPIGFDWKLTTSSIGALAAKEVFVSQLGILYAEGEADEESVPLREQLASVYTPLQGFCIMLFCLLSIPCLATLAIIRRELNSWKMMFVEAGGLFCLAYVMTFIAYHIGTILNIGTKMLH